MPKSKPRRFRPTEPVPDVADVLGLDRMQFQRTAVEHGHLGALLDVLSDATHTAAPDGSVQLPRWAVEAVVKLLWTEMLPPEGVARTKKKQAKKD